MTRVPFAQVRSGQAAAALVPVVALVLLAGCTGPSLLVEMPGFTFEPEALAVRAGQTVVWRNSGDLAHTVTSTRGNVTGPSAGPMDSGTMAPGEVHEVRFPDPGTYPYRCIPHSSWDEEAGAWVGMVGRIVVEPV